MRFSLLLLALSAPLAALAQPTKAPVVLTPGHLHQEAGGGAANRPDHLPAYPGGEGAMSAFFVKNVQVPAKAKQAGLTGDVVIQATCDTSGKLLDTKVVQGLSPECDQEALRVVQAMPAWHPATRRGVPLAILIQIPVPFANAKITEFENDRHVPRSTHDAPGL